MSSPFGGLRPISIRIDRWARRESNLRPSDYEFHRLFSIASTLFSTPIFGGFLVGYRTRYGGSLLFGFLAQNSAAFLLQVICERCHNLFDILGGLFIRTVHGVPVDIRGDTGLRMPGPFLDRVDRCAYVQQERERGVPQVVEADIRQPGALEGCDLNSRETLVWSM